MPMITVPAHFDGKQICLDEPVDLEPDTRLIVTILPRHLSDDEREAWVNLSVQGLEAGYGEDEPEYSADLIKKVNPHYAGR
ncbi:hypothetical protein J4G02_11510 [Candidatus Poribacteria bacterium]|nr:hypothetical protein [Candidatus Poribacteria bacterium]